MTFFPNQPQRMIQMSKAKPPSTNAIAPTKGILVEAEGLVNGQRQQDYGDKLQNFSQIAMLWQGYLAMKLRPVCAITPEDVSMMMILVKMARLAKSPRSSTIMFRCSSRPSLRWWGSRSFQVCSCSYWLMVGCKVPTTYSMAFCSLEL